MPPPMPRLPHTTASTGLCAPPAMTPPNGLPVYRLLTGPDDASFCHRVSEALSLGYRLYGSPAATFDGERVIVAQALLWPSVTVPGQG